MAAVDTRPRSAGGFDFEYPGHRMVRVWKDGEVVKEITLDEPSTMLTQADAAFAWLEANA